MFVLVVASVLTTDWLSVDVVTAVISDEGFSFGCITEETLGDWLAAVDSIDEENLAPVVVTISSIVAARSRMTLNTLRHIKHRPWVASRC